MGNDHSDRRHWRGRELDSRIAVALTAVAAIPVIMFPPQLTVGLAIIVLMAALGLARPGVGLGFIAVTIPIQEAITLSIGPGTMTLTRLALIPFMVGWLIRWMTQRAEIKLTPPIVAWFLVVSALIVSFPAAADRVAWAEEVYRWAVAFALYVVACDSMKTARSCRPVIIGASIGIALCAIVAAWQICHSSRPFVVPSEWADKGLCILWRTESTRRIPGNDTPFARCRLCCPGSFRAEESTVFLGSGAWRRSRCSQSPVSLHCS